MRVRATKRQRSECRDHVRRFIPGDGAAISIGTEYEVQAISVFEGVVTFQIVDDLRYPAWYPSELFEAVDTNCPDDWQCNLFSLDQGIQQIFVIGPEFVVQNLQAYNAMAELDADQVDRFWKRIEATPSEDVE